MKSWFRTFALWACSILAAAGFALAGLPKIMAVPGWIDRFSDWGYPPEFLTVVGVVEVAGALLLLIPRTALVGVGLLTTIVAGAAYTHAVLGNPSELWRPGLYGGLLVAVAVIRWTSRTD